MIKLFPTKFDKFKKAMSKAQIIDIALEDFVNYYQNHSVIKNKQVPDDDMLLFQFGCNNWDGSGEKFEINFTRQFLGKEDEFIQYSYTAKFEPSEFKALGSFNTWSIDKDSVEKWISSIRLKPFYKIIKDLRIIEKEFYQQET